VNGSRHSHLRELRREAVAERYAFDPLRTAILLMGGDKTSDDRGYEKFVPVADQLYDEHVNEWKEGKL
jgi:hypothetical protein